MIKIHLGINTNLWKWILVMLIFINTSDILYAATYYSRATGQAFNSGTLWSTTRGGTTVAYPGAAHSYVIQSGHSVNAVTLTIVQVTVESGGTFNMTGNRTLTLTNPFIIESGGTLTLATRTLTLGAGSIENSGSITGSTGEISRTTGTFTNTATGTVSISGAAAFVMGTGNFINNNTSSSVNFGSSPITVSGTAQSIGGFTTTGRFTASNTSGTVALTGGINSAGLTKSGGGTLLMGSGNHILTNTVILTAGIINGGSSTINVNFTSTTAWQGTGSVFVPGTSTVNFGGGAQTLSATGTKTFYNLTLSNSGAKTIASTTVNNILSMEGTATASAAPTYGTSATLRYNTATSRTVGAEWLATFAATGGVIIDNTGAIITNGNKVFNVNIPLTINSGATLSPAAGNTFSFGGDLINNGTWTASTGAVTINLARVSQSIGRFATTGLVTMSKTSGTATFNDNINGGAFTMNGAGTLNLGTGLTHTFTGAWTNTAGTLQGNTSTLNIGGTSSGTGVTFTAGTSTVNLNGVGAQNIPAFSYYNLNLSTGNIKTLLGNTTVSNVLTIDAITTFAASAFTLTLPGSGTPFVNSGTFTAGTSTVNFSGSGAQNIPGLTYYNLDTSTGNTKTLQGNTTVNNVLTIGASTTLDPGANTINLSSAGTPLVVSGTFTAGTSTVNFNGSAAQNIPAQTYYNLSTSTGNTKTLQGTTNVTNVLTVNLSTTLALGTNTLNLSRDGTPLVMDGTFSAGTSTVNFNATGPQNIPALTYYNLTSSNGDIKSLQGTTSVSNVLTINASTTLDLAEFILNLAGSGTPLINSGTFTCGTSTVNFTNAASTTIPALNYFDLNLTGGARVLANSGIIGIAGEFITGAGGFTVTGSTVDFNGDLDQTIPSFTFFSLLISGGGSKLIDSVVNVNEITIEDGATVSLFSDGSGILNITNE